MSDRLSRKLNSEQGVDSPAQGVDSPAQGVNSPAQGVNLPAQGVNSPAQGVNSPAQGVDSQAQEVDSPAQGVNSPAQGINSPVQGVNSPAQGVDSPAQGVNSPVHEVDLCRVSETRRWARRNGRAICSNRKLVRPRDWLASQVYSLSTRAVGSRSADTLSLILGSRIWCRLFVLRACPGEYDFKGLCSAFSGRLPSPNWLETESASPLSRWKLASLRRYARLGETGGAVGVTRTTLDSTRGSVEGVIRTTLNSAGHPLECERTTLDSTRGSVEGVTRRPQ
eukprot:113474-Prorocentrum_minimum.AAC.1